jgi:tRNA dimethylallyltransferase
VVKPPLLVIVGPTGVGKTAVAVRLAHALSLEAVSADSRQIYRGMDIGTGKPSLEEQAVLPHHLIDVVGPDERYHVARFRLDALVALEAIRARGRLPVLVGGTGLYVRSLLKGLRSGPPADPALREELEREAREQGNAALHGRLARMDPAAAGRLHPNDRIRIIRALETAGARRGADAGTTEDTDWRQGVAAWRLLMVGLSRSRETLRQHLAGRVRAMVARGMMDEVRRLLHAGYDDASPAMEGIGYRQFSAVLRGRMAEADAVRFMIRDTVRYAKRQMTWFARDPEIRWIDVDAAGGIDGTAEWILKQAAREGLIE